MRAWRFTVPSGSDHITGSWPQKGHAGDCWLHGAFEDPRGPSCGIPAPNQSTGVMVGVWLTTARQSRSCQRRDQALRTRAIWCITVIIRGWSSVSLMYTAARRRHETEIPSRMGGFWAIETVGEAGLDLYETVSGADHVRLRLRSRLHHRPGPPSATSGAEGSRL
jgi:hypothetical protein